MNTTDARQESDVQASFDASPETAPDQPPLFRPLHDRMLAGVAAGIANYLGVDVTIVRIVMAVLTFVGGAGVPIYLAGWLLIPEEGAAQSIASEFISSLQARSSRSY